MFSGLYAEQNAFASGKVTVVFMVKDHPFTYHPELFAHSVYILCDHIFMLRILHT